MKHEQSCNTVITPAIDTFGQLSLNVSVTSVVELKDAEFIRINFSEFVYKRNVLPPHQAKCIEEAKISISNTPLFLLRSVIPMGAGVPGHPLILAGQLNLSQPEEAHYTHHITKGQLISKCLIGSIVSTKKPTKFFKNFGPRGQIKKTKALYYTN